MLFLLQAIALWVEWWSPCLYGPSQQCSVWIWLWIPGVFSKTCYHSTDRQVLFDPYWGTQPSSQWCPCRTCWYWQNRDCQRSCKGKQRWEKKFSFSVKKEDARQPVMSSGWLLPGGKASSGNSFCEAKPGWTTILSSCSKGSKAKTALFWSRVCNAVALFVKSHSSREMADTVSVQR